MHIYLFSGTHWDREWYQNFQGFRYRLVSMLDHLVDYFENEDTESVFHLDGQTIVLEDYAEINPEGCERLKKLIRQGRVLIGPWYCMPDEYLVSGEALIRNLQKGYELCAAVGVEPWRCGYICDIFGHAAQMPQILSGMGITNAVLGRGTNEHTTPPFFLWQAPDGTTIDVFKLPDNNAYADFTGEVAGSRVAGFATKADTQDFDDRATRYINRLKNNANTPVVVLWDALDHEPFHEESQDYVRRIGELFPGDTVHQTNLLEALDHVGDRGGLPVLKGELRESGCAVGTNHIHLLIHVLSARQSLKRRNDLCQALLEKTLEPAMLIFGQFGYHPRDAYRKTAWKHLLQNHPHDSICGCSIDRVHSDMLYRFSQTEAITEAILREGMWQLAKGLRFAGGDSRQLAVLSTNPVPTDGFVELDIPFHRDAPKWHEPFGYEEIAAFRLYGPDGAEIPYAITERKTNTAARGLAGSTVPCDSYKVLLPLKLPGMGFTSLRVEPADKPVRFFGRLADDRATMDNGLIRAEVNGDGSIDLTDHATGRVYRNLLGLNDGAEIGDGWHHVAPVMDTRVCTTRLVEASVLVNSPLAARVRLVREMLLPARMDFAEKGKWRSAETVALRATFTLTLKKGARALEVDLAVDNTARDHRLLLTLPTGVAGTHYGASQNFAFIHRACGRDPQTHDWKEPAQYEAPMNGIVLKRGEQGEGLAFVSGGGLRECAVDDAGNIAVTLLRALGKTPEPEPEEGGQELFRHLYAFQLVPLDDGVGNTALQHRQDAMMAPPACAVTDDALTAELLRVEGAVCVSAVKPAEDGSGDWVVRLYNLNEAAEKATLVSSLALSNARLCDLAEAPLQTLEVTDGGLIELALAAGKIATVRFRAEVR